MKKKKPYMDDKLKIAIVFFILMTFTILNLFQDKENERMWYHTQEQLFDNREKINALESCLYDNICPSTNSPILTNDIIIETWNSSKNETQRFNNEGTQEFTASTERSKK